MREELAEVLAEGVGVRSGGFMLEATGAGVEPCEAKVSTKL